MTIADTCPGLTLALTEPSGADQSAIETRASDLAWQHRWEPWPDTYDGLIEHASAYSLTAALPVLAVYATARRLHFHFAHRHLAQFCEAALADRTGDPFLDLLRHAGRANLGDETSWDTLLRIGARGTTKQAHVLLTAAFTAAHVPATALDASLDLAERLAATGDAVASYRVVSLLRRAGRHEEAFLACDAACAAAARVGPALGEHLSERLVTERHLIAAHLGAPSERLLSAIA